jgi:hypothetical protein
MGESEKVHSIVVSLVYDFSAVLCTVSLSIQRTDFPHYTQLEPKVR